MVEEFVPSDIRDFLLENIDSVAELEALLLLRRHTGEVWSVQRLADRLYIDTPSADVILARLVRQGLFTETAGTICYAPKNDGHRELVDRLVDTYARFLVPVSRIIHNKHVRIQQFADAFRFRKEK
jgi:hypothetical protein